MRAFIVLWLAFKVQLIIYNLILIIIIKQITEDCLAGLVTSSTGRHSGKTSVPIQVEKQKMQHVDKYFYLFQN